MSLIAHSCSWSDAPSHGDMTHRALFVLGPLMAASSYIFHYVVINMFYFIFILFQVLVILLCFCNLYSFLMSSLYSFDYFLFIISN